MSKLTILLLTLFAIATTQGTPVTPAPTTCRINEVYLPQGVAPNCDTVCSTLGDPCYVQYIQAPFGCYCVKGYARNDNNVCIPIRTCPPKNSNP